MILLKNVLLYISRIKSLVYPVHMQEQVGDYILAGQLTWSESFDFQPVDLSSQENQPKTFYIAL